MFKRILIANRGEIAVRVAQTVQEMGITAVGLFSDPDRDALHARRCDEAYPLHGATAAETYLDIERIIDLAKTHRIDAVHPGYGFLSENAEFAATCAHAGITFIGPTPQAVRAVGDKIIAKKTAAEAGVPVVPGWSDNPHEPRTSVRADADSYAERASAIGFPVLIKAAAGGGGKGMRVVTNPADFSASWAAARREAGAAFGDARVFLERYIEKPRHVEVQIFGDTHGNVVHLFERECSLQRRHQKVMEESPSSVLTETLRDEIGAAAVRVAKAVGYTNAGTVEFMVDANGKFYFLEVNARLQVEHPVTELVAGTNLVRAQILVAAGERLPFAQDHLHQNGHALECRICAEDPDNNYLPAAGLIEHYVPPVGHGIRVDSGVTAGSTVSVYYDSLLAKLIVWAPDRATAFDKMAWALRRFVILGVTTNIEFLRRVIAHPAVRAGEIHTHFLNEHKEELTADRTQPVPQAVMIAAALAASESDTTRSVASGPDSDGRIAAGNPWQAVGGWRSC